MHPDSVRTELCLFCKCHQNDCSAARIDIRGQAASLVETVSWSQCTEDAGIERTGQNNSRLCVQKQADFEHLKVLNHGVKRQNTATLIVIILRLCHCRSVHSLKTKEQTKECEEQTEACWGQIQIEEENKRRPCWEQTEEDIAEPAWLSKFLRLKIKKGLRVVGEDRECRDKHKMSHYNAYHNRFLFYICICKHVTVDLIVI